MLPSAPTNERLSHRVDQLTGSRHLLGVCAVSLRAGDVAFHVRVRRADRHSGRGCHTNIGGVHVDEPSLAIAVGVIGGIVNMLCTGQMILAHARFRRTVPDTAQIG